MHAQTGTTGLIEKLDSPVAARWIRLAWLASSSTRGQIRIQSKRVGFIAMSKRGEQMLSMADLAVGSEPWNVDD